MLIFGGRGIAGTFFNDVWLLEICSGVSENGILWRKLFPISAAEEQSGYDGPDTHDFPSARIFSAMCALPRQSLFDPAVTYPPGQPGDTTIQDVVVFGGTDMDQNYNDVWHFGEIPFQGPLRHDGFRWRRVITTGKSPPSPRYGHSITLLPDNKHVLVLGGCDVSPREELKWGYEAETGDMRALQSLAMSLQEHYRAEIQEAVTGNILLLEFNSQHVG